MYILIADDHANVRRGLREILADAFSSARFSEASDGDGVLAQLALSQYGLFLLDINMPGRSGMEVLKDVKHIYPLLPVIMVSVQPENQYAFTLSAGRSGQPMSTRTALPKNWRRQIRKILGGAMSTLDQHRN